MTSNSQAFFEGLYEGVEVHAEREKTAEAFFSGIRDGISESSHVSIMDKIANLVDFEEDAEVEDEVEMTASDFILGRIREDA